MRRRLSLALLAALVVVAAIVIFIGSRTLVRLPGSRVTPADSAGGRAVPMLFARGLATLALLGVPATAWAQAAAYAPRTVRVGDLVYRARVRVGPDSVVAAASLGLPDPRLQAAVTVTNVGDRPVSLGRWPDCFFTTLELWPAAAARRPAGAGARRAPAWDEERWRVELKRATGIIVECDFSGGPQELELAPGASATFERQASSPWVRDVLGDSLSAGRYRAVLRIRPHTAASAAPPTVRLAAGEIVLRADGAVGGRRSRN